MRIIAVLLAFAFAASCTRSEPAANVAAVPADSDKVLRLQAMIPRIEPFFEPMGKPEAYDWLGAHNEPGQTFEQYVASDPTKPTAERQKIYVLPLGKFTPQQTAVIETVAEYLSVFYDLPVSKMQPLKMPKPAREQGRNVPQPAADVAMSRRNPLDGKLQYRTGYILTEMLKPIVPQDAAALIALTNDDLYPNASMNYVFGQAHFNDRIGVWSLRRLEHRADRMTFLRRTLKIAAHETGHMFSIWHCTKYECVMSGTNHIGETDRRPIDACPECTAKICWITDIEPAVRYKRLAVFARKHGLTQEAAAFTKKAAAVAR